jgi:hypothetical protein
MKLLCLALLVAVVAAAQVQKEHVKKFRSEAAIIWSGNQVYDLCQHYKTDKLKGSLDLAASCTSLAWRKPLPLMTTQKRRWFRPAWEKKSQANKLPT